MTRKLESRRERHTPHDDDESEYKHAVYTDAISDERTSHLAWQLAEAARVEGDPELAAVDRGLAKRYFLKCIMTRSAMEVSTMTRRDFAELWGRGILGQARYRAEGGHKRGRRGGERRRTDH